MLASSAGLSGSDEKAVMRHDRIYAGMTARKFRASPESQPVNRRFMLRDIREIEEEARTLAAYFRKQLDKRWAISCVSAICM